MKNAAIPFQWLGRWQITRVLTADSSTSAKDKSFMCMGNSKGRDAISGKGLFKVIILGSSLEFLDFSQIRLCKRSNIWGQRLWNCLRLTGISTVSKGRRGSQQQKPANTTESQCIE